MLNLLLAFTFAAVTPCYTNLNRAAGNVQIMTNLAAWVSDVDARPAGISASDAGLIATNSIVSSGCVTTNASGYANISVNKIKGIDPNFNPITLGFDSSADLIVDQIGFPIKHFIYADGTTNSIDAILSAARSDAGLVSDARIVDNGCVTTNEDGYVNCTVQNAIISSHANKLLSDVGTPLELAWVNDGNNSLCIKSITTGLPEKYFVYADGTTNSVPAILSSARSDSETIAAAAVAELTAEDVGAFPYTSGIQLTQQVSSIGAHLNAEDARFVSTNYDSIVRLPEAFVEIKMSNEWITIWREMSRWNDWAGTNFNWNAWGGFCDWQTNMENEVDNKADRAWGAYDSETGGLSPEGCVQISTPNILIAANMAYQRTVTTTGAVWVLQCNSGSARLGGETNGFFRVLDDDGNVHFEIVKGDKQEMGADATGITVNGDTLTIPYSVIADTHPIIQCCNSLTNANWKSETDADCLADVTWSGSSGAYVATVTTKSPQSQFYVKATYLSGGDTYIRNVAPVSMSSIIINGTNFYLGTAVISGNTVLTLSTTPPNP